MRLLALLVAGLFAGTLLAADDKKDDKKVKDEDAILRTWKVDKFDGGKDVPVPPAEALEKVRLTFKKDGKLTSTGRDGSDKEQKYKLDPAAKLKTIDITEGDNTVPGLYELDGDTLKLCTQVGPSKDDKFTRPTEFKADGMGVVVLTLKRVKDEKKEEKKDK